MFDRFVSFVSCIRLVDRIIDIYCIKYQFVLIGWGF